MKDDNLRNLLYFGLPLLMLFLVVLALVFSGEEEPQKPSSPEYLSEGNSPSESDPAIDPSVEEWVKKKRQSDSEPGHRKKKTKKEGDHSKDHGHHHHHDPPPKDAGEEKPLSRERKGDTRLQGQWGSGPGQFGKGQGNPPKGPAGFFVDSEGNTWVLDQENYRIQKFDSQGKLVATFPLNSRQYSLMAADPGSSKVALYHQGENRVEILGPQGELVRQVEIPGHLQPVNNLEVRGGEIYIEKGKNQFYAVNDEGKVRSLPGKPIGKGKALEVYQRSDGKVEIVYHQKGKEDGYQVAWRKSFPVASSEISSYHTDEKGNIYIVSHHRLTEGEEGKEKTLLDERQVIRFDSQGKYMGDVNVESQGVRSGRVYISPSGEVYQMTYTPQAFRVAGYRVIGR